MSDTSRATPWIVSYDLPTCFGDGWSAAKVLTWKLLDVPGAQLVPSPDLDDAFNDSRSWWQAVVDVLMYSKGWTNLAEELRRWRMYGYPADDPVLSFVKQTWGKTLIALEWYLATHPFAAEKICEQVTRARGLPYTEPHIDGRLDVSLIVDLTNQVQRLDRNHPAHNLMNLLVFNVELDELNEHTSFGGSDSAHLALHFCVKDTHGAASRDPSMSVMISHHSAILYLEKYEGWYHKLHDLRFDSLNNDSYLTNIEITEVNVIITGMGSLGTFVFDESVSCFIRQNSGL